MSDQPTVSDLFRRALEIREANPNASYDDIKSQIASENNGKHLPSPAFLTIPELDSIAPEEDWTAGLPIVLRGIQTESWDEVAHGIIISLEQVENYPKESGREDDPAKEWRDRDKDIKEFTSKSVGKWMPDDLMNIAEKSSKQ